MEYFPNQACGNVATTKSPVTTPPIGPCLPNQFQCQKYEHHAGLICIPNEKVCNFVNDCDDKSDEAECGTCDFENGMCGFYDKSYGDIKWDLRKAPSFLISGPKVDHTTNSTNGHYMVTYEDFSTGVFKFF